MDDKKIEENIKIIDALIEKYIVSDRKEKIKKILESEFGLLYFSAPASSKKQYHLSYPGGLAEHSINVYKNLKKLNSTFNFNFNEESMLVCALFHDIGKASTTDLNKPHYLPASDSWKLNKGINYENNVDTVYLPNHQRSLYIFQAFGIKLLADEYQAILLNDGHYLTENAGYKMKECPLALLLHMADRTACEQEKEE